MSIHAETRPDGAPALRLTLPDVMAIAFRRADGAGWWVRADAAAVSGFDASDPFGDAFDLSLGWTVPTRDEAERALSMLSAWQPSETREASAASLNVIRDATSGWDVLRLCAS